MDLVLLPSLDRPGKALVLVEEKLLKNAASLADVIGQLLKYYANALGIGSTGLDRIRAFAGGGVPASYRRISLKRMLGANALHLLSEGPLLRPEDIDLIVALDGSSRLVDTRLWRIVSVLRKRHELPIRVVVVENGTPRDHMPAGVDGRETGAAAKES